MIDILSVRPLNAIGPGASTPVKLRGRRGREILSSREQDVSSGRALNPRSVLVERPDAVIEILIEGEGELVLLLPSLGRGAADFDSIADRLASASFKVARPQPRGIGRSDGPMDRMDLHDCAADIAAVISAIGDGRPAVVAGHAFGNRVARMLATDRPDLVRGVVLIAANVGKAPSPPEIRTAIRNSANSALPEADRLAALQFAFFAPGNDASVWLTGWNPHVLAAQRLAGDRTSREEDYAGGQAPILYLQPSHDPLAHVEDAILFKQQLGDRVRVQIIPGASHAAVVERPEFIAEAVEAFARSLR
jgi:pimeloyl-ACP methyl ester carboxylesterase